MVMKTEDELLELETRQAGDVGMSVNEYLFERMLRRTLKQQPQTSDEERQSNRARQKRFRERKRKGRAA